jgi:hypothetical protein
MSAGPFNKQKVLTPLQRLTAARLRDTALGNNKELIMKSKELTEQYSEDRQLRNGEFLTSGQGENITHIGFIDPSMQQEGAFAKYLFLGENGGTRRKKNRRKKRNTYHRRK